MTQPARIRSVPIGPVTLGPGRPVRIQSMVSVSPSRLQESIHQLKACEQAGAEIMRVSVRDQADTRAIAELKRHTPMPIVADIHYNYKLALAAADHGADKLRINPGNLGGKDNLQRVCDKAMAKGIPIRVGVNAGSLERELKTHGRVTPEQMVESAARNVRILEERGFFNIVVSLKANDVTRTVASNRLFRESFPYPLHIGVTEAGPAVPGMIKSAMAFYDLLRDGIGETLRVSLSAPPVEEIVAGWEIVKAMGLRRRGLEVVSCPTCGRKNFDVIAVSTELQQTLRFLHQPVSVAVMGCPVNGLDEARHVDVGVCGIAPGKARIFFCGREQEDVQEAEIMDVLVRYIKKAAQQRGASP